MNHFESRLFEIQAPFDLGLRYIRNGRSDGVYLIPDLTRLDDDLISQFVMPMPPQFWRDRERPVVQLSIPYYFVCDEVCFLNQLPPYLSPTMLEFPGIVISGRFPTHIWPRSLNLAFEWVDFRRDLVFRKGDPLCYLQFETERPDAPIHVVEAESTLELQEYRALFEDIPKYTSGTWNYTPEIVAKRPSSLLRRKYPHADVDQ